MMEQVNGEYNSLKKEVVTKVDKALKGTNALKGAWSIDIMKNGPDLYFIDAAVMEESALVNRMEPIVD